MKKHKKSIKQKSSHETWLDIFGDVESESIVDPMIYMYVTVKRTYGVKQQGGIKDKKKWIQLRVKRIEFFLYFSCFIQSTKVLSECIMGSKCYDFY